MGHLIKLKLETRGKETLLDKELRSAPFFSRYLSSHALYEFRAKETGSSDATPDCSAMIEPDGVLLNSLGDAAVYEAVSEHLKKLLRKEVGEFDAEF